MSIQYISRILIHLFNTLRCFSLIGIVPVEIHKLFFHLLRNLITAVRRQRFHQFGIYLGVITGNTVNQTFQVTGNENIHGWRTCQHKFSLTIICTSHKEIIQNFIFIRCANQLADRHTHILSIKCGEDVPEITCRHYNVDFLAIAYFTFFQ